MTLAWFGSPWKSVTLISRYLLRLVPCFPTWVTSVGTTILDLENNNIHCSLSNSLLSFSAPDWLQPLLTFYTTYNIHIMELYIRDEIYQCCLWMERRHLNLGKHPLVLQSILVFQPRGRNQKSCLVYVVISANYWHSISWLQSTSLQKMMKSTGFTPR